MNWKYYKPKFEYEKLFDDSAWPWEGHKNFAYDLVANIRPKTIVELGTHYGTSLWSFSQSVKDQKINTKISAVDTWKGENHAGYYGEEVFGMVNKIKDTYYKEQKIYLIRKTFDLAVSDFDDGSIDILHIDGLHTYEAVKHDFESWLPKVSKNGIIILHDTSVGERDFGVYKLWGELKKKYSTIEFFQSFGLGVLFLNKKLGKEMKGQEKEWQMHYSYIHEMGKVELVHTKDRIIAEVKGADTQKNKEIKRMEDVIGLRGAELKLKNQEIQHKNADLLSKDIEIEKMKEGINLKDVELKVKAQELQLKNADLLSKNQEIQAKNTEIQQKIQETSSHLQEIQRMTTSRFWKIKTFYEKFKNPILRHSYTANRLSKKAVFVFKRDGFRRTVSCATEYLFSSSKLSKELKRGEVLESDDTPYKKWIKNIEKKQKTLEYQDIEKKIKKLSYQPKISVIFPVFNTDEIFLRKAIFSVIEQYYQNWELCIVDDRSERVIIKKILNEFGNRDPRIKVKILEKNLGISGATNEAVGMASGEFIAFLDHDDELEPEAFYENIKLLNENKELDLIYSDDDKIDENGFRYDPQFKPDWSPELLLSYCYVSHLKILRKKLFVDLGGFRDKFNGSQDYDFLLRLAEKTDKVGHISKVLYHWRSIPGSVAHSSAEKPASIERGRMAVEEALDRRGIKATVSIPDFAERSKIGVYKIDFDPRKYQDMVTIIIPTKDNVSILKRCIDSIRSKTNYSNYEILVINNNSVEKQTFQYLKDQNIRTIDIKTDKFNFSKINNMAVEQVKSEFVLFLNNDTEIISPNWLLEMVGSMQISKKIGAVGAKLIYFDGRIQHAGVLLGLHDNSAGHAHKLAHKDDPGYLCYASVLRNYSAVTAACLLTRKSLFNRVGGFDEKKLSVSYNDVDFCLKLLRLGYRIVYNPGATLYHHEGKSRGFTDNPDELNHFKNTWKEHIVDDPHYNINLSLENEKFEIKQKN